MSITEDVKPKQTLRYESVIPLEEIDRKFNDIVVDAEGNTTYPIIADLKLIETIKELKEFAVTCKGKRIAVDTETTGLSYLHDVIVGFSVSCDAYSGIYVPIRHQHKKIFKNKETRVDEDGNVMLTKTGKPRTHTVETYEFTDYEGNLDPKRALDILYEIMLNASIVLMHNSEFDMNMIKKEGYDVMKCKTFDTMLLPYIYDPEARLNGLKPLVARLGRRVPDFSEATGGEKEFQYTNPKESYIYAASDTCSTYWVFDKLYPLVRKLLSEAKDVITINGKKYDILQEDNKLIRAFIDYYGHVELNIDKEVARQYKDLIDKETAETVEAIFSYFRIGPFSLSTGSNEFKNVMKKFNMNTGAKTKTGGNVSYGKEGIKEMNKNINNLKNNIWSHFKDIVFIDSKIYMDRSKTGLELAEYLDTYGKPYLNITKRTTVAEIRDLNNKKIDKEQLKNIVKDMYKQEKKKLEILQLILKYSSLMKALNSYVTKLTEVDKCRMRYRLTGTKSCRLSSGNGSKTSKDKNDYYIDLNAQNFTKPKPQFYKAKQDYGENHILGWTFEPVSDEYADKHKEDEYIVEGASQTANVRACIKASEGRLIASLDYSSQELKMAAIQSRDPALLKMFMGDGHGHGAVDPHEYTARMLWPDSYDKFKRRKAKACNFLMSYSGGPRTLAETLEIPFEEAKEIVDNYNKVYFVYKEWKERDIDEMVKNKGKVFTVFGRPRQLLPWLKLSRELNDPGLEAYAFRSVNSHKIQSSCGDICRKDLLGLYNRFYKNRDPHIDFTSTVHDEINQEIDNDPNILIPYLREIEDIMTITELMPELPITISIDLGYSLGSCFPFQWTDESRTMLVPKKIH